MVRETHVGTAIRPLLSEQDDAIVGKDINEVQVPFEPIAGLIVEYNDSGLAPDSILHAKHKPS
jgi:hypothetical protein